MAAYLNHLHPAGLPGPIAQAAFQGQGPWGGAAGPTADAGADSQQHDHQDHEARRSSGWAGGLGHGWRWQHPTSLDPIRPPGAWAAKISAFA